MALRRALLPLLFGLALLGAAAERASAQMGDLVGLLTSQLGVTEPQAAGGAGALFDYAKQQLSPADFGKVSSGLPGLDGLIAGVASGGGAGSLTDLAGSFSQLCLSPDMIGKFVPVVLDYAQASGGQEVLGLLQSVLLAG